MFSFQDLINKAPTGLTPTPTVDPNAAGANAPGVFSQANGGGINLWNVLRTQFDNLTGTKIPGLNVAPNPTSSNTVDPNAFNFTTAGTGAAHIDANQLPANTGTQTGTQTGPDVNALKSSIQSRIAALQQAYQSQQDATQPLIQQKMDSLNQNYDTQQKSLNNSLGTTTNQLQAMYGARGLQDSSFNGNALQNAGDTYNNSLTALNQDKASNIAGLGQYAQNAQTGAQSASAQYASYLPHLDSYSATDLQTLDNQLASQLPVVQQQLSGMGTQQQFTNDLNKFVPAQSDGNAKLAQQLQTLASSSAPLFAKNQIAQGVIKSSQLTDPSAQAYYSDYFKKLLSGQGA